MEGTAARLEFLYRLRAERPEMVADGPTAEESAVLEEHFAYLSDLTERGVVVLAGRTLNADAGAFGIVVFRAGSEEEAREIMEGDPAVRKGMMRSELFPYKIALLGA